MKKISEIMQNRWRGFNLQGLFVSPESKDINLFYNLQYYPEEKFKIISDWGFNYVRLPLSYRCWSSAEDPYTMKEEVLEKLDEAIYFGEKYGLHIDLGFHRAPGYCVNDDEDEKFDLWTDSDAQKAFVYQFTEIAKRYKNYDNDKVTFNFINEPKDTVSVANYAKVFTMVQEAVEAVTPGRIFTVDGHGWAHIPPADLMEVEKKNVIYSCRGYEPAGLTHYLFSKLYQDTVPTWPNALRCVRVTPREYIRYDYKKLRANFEMWKSVCDIYGQRFFCGEFGCNSNTPHDVTLAWLEDLLSIFKELNIGWAMWNLSGPFGVMDSGRKAVESEDYYGYKLDRKMLDIMMKY